MSSRNAKARLQARVAATKKRQEEEALAASNLGQGVTVEDEVQLRPSQLPEIFSFIADCETANELEAAISGTHDKCESTINHCSHTKGTPLIFAIWNASTTGRLDMIHVLLKYGAKVDVRDCATDYDIDDQSILPPIFMAVAKPCLTSIEILAKAGANMEDTVMLFSCLYQGRSLKHPPMNLFVWAMCSSARRCANRFLVRAAIVNSGNHSSAYGVPVPRTDPIVLMNKVSSLMKAYSETALKQVDDSIYARLPGHQKSLVGCAVSIHAPATLSLLLDMGADPNVEDMERSSPLYTACSSGDDEMALLLVESGAIPDETTLKEFGVHDPDLGKFVHPALLRFQHLDRTGLVKRRPNPFTDQNWSSSSPTVEQEKDALPPLDEAQVTVIEDALGDAGFLDLEDAIDLSLPNKEV
jgi:hypothetical protein